MHMDHLQCPFTWKSRILPEVERIHRVDKLPLAPSSWTKILLKLSLAFTDHRAGNYERAAALIIECYMPLLSYDLKHPNSFHTDCYLIQHYRIALKHVLDSTWAYIRWQACCDDDDYAKHLSDFVASISVFKDMDSHQKAAVYAIRAFLSKSPKNLEFIRKAISLNQTEGQWHCALGKLLLMNRIPKTAHYPGRPPSQEEVRALREAYHLRKDPESCTLLAESWLDNGPNGHSMAAAIIQDALRLFPTSPSVHARAARVLWLLPAPQLDLTVVEACYRRALQLAGECLFLRFKLGGLCVILDKLQEAREHYEKAAAIYPEAEEVLASLNRLPLLRTANARLMQQCCAACRSAASHPIQEQEQSLSAYLSPIVKDSVMEIRPPGDLTLTVKAPSIFVERRALGVNSVTEVTDLRRLVPPPETQPASMKKKVTLRDASQS